MTLTTTYLTIAARHLRQSEPALLVPDFVLWLNEAVFVSMPLFGSLAVY